jgi:hypothetical protein
MVQNEGNYQEDQRIKFGFSSWSIHNVLIFWGWWSNCLPTF